MIVAHARSIVRLPASTVGALAGGMTAAVSVLAVTPRRRHVRDRDRQRGTGDATTHGAWRSWTSRGTYTRLYWSPARRATYARSSAPNHGGSPAAAFSVMRPSREVAGIATWQRESLKPLSWLPDVSAR